MANKYAHLREKAITLRREHNMTLDDLVERLQLPRTTIYYWIKDIPIPYTEKQRSGSQKGADKIRKRHAAIRKKTYRQGWEEAPELLKDPTFRDFVVLYMAEGYKRNRNQVSFANSDGLIISLANRWICRLSANKIEYQVQLHVDHDNLEEQEYWASVLQIEPNSVKVIRKSNSGQMSGRNFRSAHGVLTVRVGDTYFRAKLQAWMDFVKAQW